MNSKSILLYFAVFMIAIISFRCSSSDGDLSTVEFTVDATTIYETDGVNFSLTNPQAISEVSWYFEGGEPEYFNDLNPPTIYYGKAGNYSVTLHVMVKGRQQVINKENFILVQEKPNQNFSFSAIFAEKAVMKGGETIDVWVSAAGEDLQYEWSSNFGSIKSEGPEAQFTASHCFEGMAEISALVYNDFGSMERTVKVKVERGEEN